MSSALENEKEFSKSGSSHIHFFAVKQNFREQPNLLEQTRKGSMRGKLKQNAHYGSRSKLKFKVKYYITFPVCNLLTRAMSPVRLACGKLDSPKSSTIEFTLFK
ncbi:hypothetical protein ACLK29_14310 [Leptospira kirschneri]